MPSLTARRGASAPSFRHRVTRILRILRVRIMCMGVCSALALPRPAHGGGPPASPGGPLYPQDVLPSPDPPDHVSSRVPLTVVYPLTALPSLVPLAALLPSDPRDSAAADPWLATLGPPALFDTPDPSNTADIGVHAAESLGSRRGLWLGVSGGFSSSPGERERIFGLVELGIGLDVWVGDRALALAPSSDPPGGDEPGSDEPGSDEPGAARAAVFPARSPAASSPAAFAPSFPMPPDSRGLGQRAPFRQALAADAPTAPASASTEAPARIRFPSGDARSSDPGVLAALARAALAEARRIGGEGSELRRLDGMAARSRAAASLPEVRLGAGTSRDESLRLQPTATDPGRFTRDGGRDLWLEARLTWRLDSAIFASQEVAIMRLRAQRREEAARLAAEVLEALVDWQRARLSLASERALPEERDAALIRQFGAVARLDLLTDGWFSRQLERAPRPADRAPWP
jgi:hypothetical protein